ncbi:restriction endonuclease subunit S [Bisgaard Taxon 45]
MNTLPSGWERKKLGDLFEFKNGLNTDKSQYGKGTKFVNVMDIFNNTLLTENNILGRVTISEKQFEENKLNYGDILFNRTSEIFDEIAIAAVYMDCKPAVFGGFVIRARAIKNVFDAVYSSYGFQSDFFRKQVVKLGQGAIRANIGQKDLAKVNILIPPLSEQTKIANILSTWDKAIQTTEQLLANSQQQKKALMQQLLTGKKRLKGFSGEWRETQLRKLLIESRITEKVTNDAGRRLTVRLNLKGIERREERGTEAENVTAHFIRRAGQFIYGKQNFHKGAFGIIPKEFDFFETSQDIPTFDFVEKYIVASWFYYFCAQEWFYKSLENYVTGTGSKRLNPKEFLNITLHLPSIEEQQKIAQILSTQDHEIDTFQQKLACLKQEKKALMQKLLSGKVRV